jgi:hypothetical protein
MAESGTRAGRASVLAGISSVATLPVAVYLTRYSERYELLHAGFAVPLGAALGMLAIALARRSRRRHAVSLAVGRRGRAARVGGLLGIIGLCMALAALVALGVYGLLEWAGSRE